MNDLELGTCVKTMEKEVLFQNELCIEICGDQKGQVCLKGCMTSYAAVFGMTLIKNLGVDNAMIDAVVINNGKTLTTLQYPLTKSEDELKKAKAKLMAFGLSKSELNIFLLVMSGKKNSEIQKELFISKPTLKTHLNNIYKKLPERYQQYKKRR